MSHLALRIPLALLAAFMAYGADEPVAWLQIAYLAAGAVLALLGAVLWRATTDDRTRWARTGHHLVGHA